MGDEHVRRYVETDGAVGHLWNGVPCLILTTVGRRSGIQRHHPLIYTETDLGYAVAASKGGAPSDPEWYRNLCARPAVRVQICARRFDATARTASGTEEEGLWTQMARTWPNYDLYRQRTTRHIPIVLLTPSAP
jgi:deazaflavin-dependent oxidoreductase (nitroreductase family)